MKIHSFDKEDIKMAAFFTTLALMAIPLFILTNHTTQVYVIGLAIFWVRAVIITIRIFKMSRSDFISNYHGRTDTPGKFEAAFFPYLWPVFWPLVGGFCAVIIIVALPQIADKLLESIN